MTASFSNPTKKPVYWLLMIFILSSSLLLGQKNLSGNLNQPFARVTNIIAIDEIEVDDITGFSAGDTILFIQMQGVGILTGTAYGNYQTSFGTPGAHEFLIIQSIAGNEITFTNDLINTYDIRGSIQIVRVPYYNYATVTGKLYCDPWDPVTGKGGVLALILGSSLKLNADIDLSGLGLNGAPSTAGDGIARSIAGTNNLSYPVTETNAGTKGEGIAIHDESGVLLYPAHARGEGKNYTGGGGGNGRYSGGGGGSHRGNGGVGGYEDYDIPQLGGYGGIKVAGTLADGRIFMGGGGGSSTSLSGSGGSGGNGGGIVLIVTDTIVGNGGRILVNGNKGGDAVANGGAGGGGGGGSIALSLSGYGPSTSPLVLHAAGGNGGNNPGLFGEGGGGGGGLIYVSKPLAVNVTAHLEGGSAGIPTNGALGGDPGEKKENFEAVLNGFLFNSIRSSVSGTQLDAICSDSDPPKITGTTPVGGTGTYTYAWEKSDDDINWDPIPGATAIDYNPGVDFDPETVTASAVYYRRIVSDGSLNDISKSVKFIIQPYIKNNTIGADQTICYNQDPAALVSTGALAGGTNSYGFRWEVSFNSGAFNLPANAHNQESYDPPALTDDARYRRIVTSGRCADTSALVSVTVLDLISNNTILSQPQDICVGTTFDPLNGSVPAGGDGTFSYLWESNINDAGWGPASGINNATGYSNPVETGGDDANTYYYRRIVRSGPGDVCVNTSSEILLREYPVITNNNISSPQTICEGEKPLILTGSQPGKGNGIYTYIWQDSSLTNSWVWTDIAGATSDEYSPGSLTQTTRYRRVVRSSACTDISKSVRIDVDPSIIKYGILSADTTVCDGQNPDKLRGQLSEGGTGTFAYQWLYSGDNVNYNPVTTSATGADYDPPVLPATTYYRRETRSGVCRDTSGTVTITVLGPIRNNTLSSNQVICYNTAPAQLTGATLTGGDGNFSYRWEESSDGGHTWGNATGVFNDPSGNYNPPPLIRPMQYRRMVTSGLNNCCSSLSEVIDISIHPELPTAHISNSDTTIYSGTPVIVKLNLTGSGPWQVTLSENSRELSYTVIDTGKGEITVSPQETSTGSFIYKIIRVTDTYGCYADANGISGELVASIFPGFEIPEGFSPNGDGYNDTFVIKGLNPDPELQSVDLRIVTASGSEVFHTSNYAGQEWKDWDGKDSAGRDVAEGTYYYLFKAQTNLNNKVDRQTGFIILKRY